MPIEQLTYVEIAGRLGVTPQAVRTLVKRHRLPRLRNNEGAQTLVAIDVEEIRGNPKPDRSPRAAKADIATLKARVFGLTE